MKIHFTLLLSGIAIAAILPFDRAEKKIDDNYLHQNTSYGSSSIKLRIDTPDQDRFVKVNLIQGQLSEPTEMAVLPNLDILVAKRRGEIMLYKQKTKKLQQAGKLDVYFKTSVPDVNAEEGLLGMAADPEFGTNGYVGKHE